MKLLIVRHAIAANSALTGDAARPLTQEGVDKFQKVAEFLGQRIKEEDSHLIVSPYLRAQQTADILAAHVQIKERSVGEHLTPESSVEDGFKEITSQVCKLVICVGHQPHLGSLVSFCVTGGFQPIVQVSRGSATMIEFHNAIRKGAGVIRFVISPKIL